MNRNFAIVIGFGAFVVLILALLLKKGPTSNNFGDIGSKLSLPSLGGADEASIKNAIGDALKPFDLKPIAPAHGNWGNAGLDYNKALASWNARNP